MINLLYPVCFILLIWSDHFPGYSAKPIHNGQHDQGNEVIWQVSYQKKRSNRTWLYTCGGSILSSKHIVTAAHCFSHLGEDKTKVWDRNKREKTRIVIGTINLNAPGTGIKLKIGKVIIPRAYTRLEDNTLLADIAVIELEKHLDLSINREKYGLIDLFYPKDETEKNKYDDQEGFVAGFGTSKLIFRRDGKRTHVFDGLRNILPVHLTDYKCPKVHGARCVRYMESAKGPRGLCHGDSGGPLYYRIGNKFELVGVISRGPRDCDIRKSNKKIGKITFIPDYRDFLEKTRFLNTKTTFPNMSVKDFEESGVDYIVLLDRAALARKYYVKPIEQKEGKKPCNH